MNNPDPRHQIRLLDVVTVLTGYDNGKPVYSEPAAVVDDRSSEQVALDCESLGLFGVWVDRSKLRCGF